MREQGHLDTNRTYTNRIISQRNATYPSFTCYKIYKVNDLISLYRNTTIISTTPPLFPPTYNMLQNSQSYINQANLIILIKKFVKITHDPISSKAPKPRKYHFEYIHQQIITGIHQYLIISHKQSVKTTTVISKF